MAHVRLTGSKKSVVFVDEDGTQFFTSVNFIVGLLNGKAPNGFVQLKKFASKVDMSRFQPSELWVPDGVDPRTLESGDMTTKEGKKELQETKAFSSDDKVW